MKRSTLKKAAAIILMLASVLLCSCKKTVKTVTVSTTTTDAAEKTTAVTFPVQPKATNTETIDNETVYNANGLTVKAEALDFNDADTDLVKVKFRITNETAYDLKVALPMDENSRSTVLVNGKEVQATLLKTLKKPETVVWLEMYWHQLRSEYGIETIETIELKLIFSEAGIKDAKPLYTTDTIKLTTKKA